MHKKLVFTAAFFCVLSVGVLLYAPRGQGSFLDTSAFVTIGNPKAPVHMILLEEFACSQCERFHEEDLPHLYTSYIDKGLLKLTTIPLAYLKESRAAAIASCCVANVGKEHYRGFIEYVFSIPQEKRETLDAKELLYSYASHHPDLPLQKILDCTQSEKVFDILEANLHLSDSLERDTIEVPTILINGRFIKEIRLETISEAIQEELGNRHV